MKQSQVIYIKGQQGSPHNNYAFAKRKKVYADAPPKLVQEIKSEVKTKATRHAIEEAEKLKNLTSNSRNVLFTCKSVFPFDFFPDKITIEPTQINIHQKTFYLTHHLLTIPIKNISDIHVHTSIFFASLTFIDRSFAENTITIEWLKKSDAYRVRKIVQGLIIAMAEEIDVDKIDTSLLKRHSEQLGNMHRIEV